MAILNVSEEIKRVDERLKEPEQTLGKGLNQPFNILNSGARKIMFGTHQEHRLPLFMAEAPLVATGYENLFGEYSSAYKVMLDNCRIVAKIPKFSWAPNWHYFLILENIQDGELSIIERMSYTHITESYGYLINNETLDDLKVGDELQKGQVFQKSSSYDEYDNRMDGINLTTVYLSNDLTMEDGILISDEAAAKLMAPLIKRVDISINDNEMLLNIHGDSKTYKSIPDIGERCESTLCILRSAKKDEALYTQSNAMLHSKLMSDTEIIVDGYVIDIDLYCNNPDNLKNDPRSIQLLRYYEERLRVDKEIIETVEAYTGEGLGPAYSLSPDLAKIYYIAKAEADNRQYIKDKVFSNIVMSVYVLDAHAISEGDKLSDRYGGKGVVSYIIPQKFMPELEDGTKIEVINNSSTCVGRQNPGQLFELSITRIGRAIQEFIRMNVLDTDQSIDLYLSYLKHLSEELFAYTEELLTHMSDEERQWFINSVSNDDGIMLALNPISDNMSIDVLEELYDEFPYVHQEHIYSLLTDSNGRERRVKSDRPVVVGKKYFYRLKQYAEEKFSATSLSSTNLRNENSRNKANKAYKAHFAKTPIKFGEMETGDMGHLGMEYVVQNLMLHSVAPLARRSSAEKLLTGDPFDINVELDTDAMNRNAEILAVYLKAIGLRLVFRKIPKKLKQLLTKYPVTDLGFAKPVELITKLEAGENIDKNYLNKLADSEPGVKPLGYHILGHKIFEEDDGMNK